MGRHTPARVQMSWRFQGGWGYFSWCVFFGFAAGVIAVAESRSSSGVFCVQIFFKKNSATQKRFSGLCRWKLLAASRHRLVRRWTRAQLKSVMLLYGVLPLYPVADPRRMENYGDDLTDAILLEPAPHEIAYLKLHFIGARFHRACSAGCVWRRRVSGF